MKRRALILTAALLFAAAPAYAADLGGIWQVAITGGNTPSCTLVQKAKALSGTCSAQMTGTAAGSVDGKNVKWTWTISLPGLPSIIQEFSGQWDLKDAISGNVTSKVQGAAQSSGGPRLSLPPDSTFTAARQPGK